MKITVTRTLRVHPADDGEAFTLDPGDYEVADEVALDALRFHGIDPGTKAAAKAWAKHLDDLAAAEGGDPTAEPDQSAEQATTREVDQ